MFKLQLASKNGSTETWYFNPFTVSLFTSLDELTPAQMRTTNESHKSIKTVRTNKPTTLKIYLGNCCNYRCSYCRQHEHNEKQSANDYELDSFIERLRNNVCGIDITHIEFWGGEPLLYMNEITGLVSRLNDYFTDKKIKYSITTNGSLMTDELLDYFVEHNFTIKLSHDGPGQYLRGPHPSTCKVSTPENDPLHIDAPTRKVLQRAHVLLSPDKRFGINSVLTEHNKSIKELLLYEQEIFGRNIIILKTEAVIPYNANSSKQTTKLVEYNEFTELMYKDLTDVGFVNFKELHEWFHSLVNMFEDTDYCTNLYESRCHMNVRNTLTIDLDGFVYPCQVYGGTKTTIGLFSKHANISVLNEIIPHPAITDDRCHHCHVVSMCKGSCPYITNDEYRKSDCHMRKQILSAAFKFYLELLTKHKLLTIEECV